MQTNAGDGRTITFLDLFSGIGAFRLGFERSCAAMGLTARCLGFSEIDGPATATYLRHFPDTRALGDIRTLAESGSAPACDVVLGGFPCQDASMAGGRQGLEGDRGWLFFDLVDTLAAARPTALLLENVRGLASLDGGRAMATVLDALRLLGYSVRYAVLNSRDFGVPQNRPRVYIAGFLGGDDGFEFPAPTDPSKRLVDVLDGVPADPCYCLTKRAIERIRRHRERHAAKGNGFGAKLVDPARDVSGTLMASNWGRDREFIADGEGFRRLTPTEWERLQGLPHRFTAGQADGHRYRQIGNAVTVPVIEAVACNLLAALGKADEEAHDPKARTMSHAVRPPSARPVAVEVCCGCGGLTTGLEQAGFEVAVACDIDPDAAETCRLNHPHTTVLTADISDEGTRHAITDALGGRRCDLLAAGLPCQAYSTSGRRGQDDPRGSLFRHFMALVGRLRPRVAVIENVRGILSMRRPDGSRVTGAIGVAFRRLGYASGHLVLDAADFGDAQCRERVVVFAWRHAGLPDPERTHDEHGRGGLTAWRTYRDAIHDLEGAPEDHRRRHVFTRHGPDMSERIGRTPVGGHCGGRFGDGYRRGHPGLPAPLIKSVAWPIHYAEPRTLTCLEAARIQSFPDSYLFVGGRQVVATMIGNAVPVGLATGIGKAVLKMISAGVTPKSGITGEDVA